MILFERRKYLTVNCSNPAFQEVTDIPPKLQELQKFAEISGDIKTEEEMQNLRNYVNNLILWKYDINDEDIASCYITILKKLARNIDSNFLCVLYDSATKNLPILTVALEFSFHKDTMIKNAARIALLTITKKCGHVFEIRRSSLRHFKQVILSVKNSIFHMERSMENYNSSNLIQAYYEYEQELEYVDNLMSLNICTLSTKMHQIVINEIILPLYKFTLGYLRNSKVYSLLSYKMCLFLLSKFVHTVSDYDSQMLIILLFIRGPDNIGLYNTESMHEIPKNSQATVFCCLVFLNTITNLLNKHSKETYLCFYQKYLDPVSQILKHSIEGRIAYKKNIQLKLITSILKPLLLEKHADNNELFKLKNCCSKFIRTLYFNTSHLLQKYVKKGLDIFSLIDFIYEEYNSKRIDLDHILRNVASLLDGDKQENITSNITNSDIDVKVISIVEGFLCLRNLSLIFKEKEEKTLPFFRAKKLKIGRVLPFTDCISCKKLCYNNVWVTNHYFKITINQVIILQKRFDSDSSGIVIFNPYYKDLQFSKIVSTGLTLNDQTWEVDKHIDVKLKIQSIKIKFKTSSQAALVENTLSQASKIQNEMLEKKLEDILETDYIAPKTKSQNSEELATVSEEKNLSIKFVSIAAQNEKQKENNSTSMLKDYYK